jgi:hypothetical protein
MAESLRTTRHYPDVVPRMWIWVQALIVVFVLAGMVIAIVKMA